MKTVIFMSTALVFVLSISCLAGIANAGTVEEVKEGSKKTAQTIKEGAIDAGMATVETGKQIKEGSQKAWKDVKEGVKEVGKDFKKAYEDTRDAIRGEVSAEARGEKSEVAKDAQPEQKPDKSGSDVAKGSQ